MTTAPSAAADRPPPRYRLARRETRENQKLKSIDSRRLLKAEDYQDATLADLEARIRAGWTEFVERDLSGLITPIHKAAPFVVASSVDGEAIGGTANGATVGVTQDL